MTRGIDAMRCALRGGAAGIVCAALLAAPARSQVTERVSVDSSGTQGNGHSYLPSASADGLLVAFESSATNLVSGDTNGESDCFVRDRTAASTQRISVSSSGSQSNGPSAAAVISDDGTTVAFVSLASNLASNDGGYADVFVHDLASGVTEVVSLSWSGAGGNGHSGYEINGHFEDYYPPSLSSDGRFVAFRSLASNLVTGDSNANCDVFVHDRSTGVTERVSVSTSGAQADQGCLQPSISSDGNLVAFVSFSSLLVGGDTNSQYDVFVHDRTTGITEQVSVDAAGNEGDWGSVSPSISADGHTVAFESLATNLVPGDTNLYYDAFVHDRCLSPASWTNYGAGFPGTLGIPSFTARSNPLLGSNLTLDFANSLGQTTVGLLFVGLQRANLHSGWGGDLLLVPSVTIPIALPATGDSLSGVVPPQESNCGVAIDLQIVEADPGAAHGVSFTPGLELLLGR